MTKICWYGIDCVIFCKFNYDIVESFLWNSVLFRYSEFLTSEDERRELQEIPATELQQFAIKFVLGVREKNGT